MVDPLIPTSRQSAQSYCHNSQSHFSIFQNVDPYRHNPHTNLLYLPYKPASYSHRSTDNSLPLVTSNSSEKCSYHVHPLLCNKAGSQQGYLHDFFNIALSTTGGQINASICPPAVNLPSGCPIFLCRISAAWKNRSFTLRARKYELRVAEPIVFCRALVPMMTAAYAHRSTPNARSGFFFLCLLHRFSFSNALLKI